MTGTSSAKTGHRWQGVTLAVTVGLIPLSLAAPDAARSAPLAEGTADLEGVSRAVAGHRIKITVTGALPMTKAKLTLKGVKGKAKGSKKTVKVAKRKTVKQLPPGRYQITAAKMTHHGARAKAVPRKWRVTVTGRQGAAVQVAYARVPGAVERVSTSSRDKQADGSSWSNPLWSPDCTWIAFGSEASNLVPGDADKNGGLFVKNLTTGKTTLVSAAGLSGTTWVSRTRLAFFAYSRTAKRYFGVVRDVRTGRTWTAPLPPFPAAVPSGWSPQGTAFVYQLSRDRGPSNLYVKTLATGAVTPVSATADGVLGNGGSDMAAWSPDGTRVAFDSNATNLTSRRTRGRTHVYVKSLATGALELVSADANGNPGNFGSYGPVWSPDGTRIAYVTHLAPRHAISSGDLVARSLATGSVQRISSEAGWDPSWSPDGSKISFVDGVRGTTDTMSRRTWVRDLATGSLSRLPVRGPLTSADRQWSPDGTTILFSSSKALVPGDTNARNSHGGGYDAFVVNVGSKHIKRVSTTSRGKQIHAACDPEADPETGVCYPGSFYGVWSPDGTRIAFVYGSSTAPENLVPNDTNRSPDVFVKTLK